MKDFEIWVEGYAATGEHAPASFEGIYAGNSFKEACVEMMLDKSWDLRYYDKERNTYWGCRFFDNEAEARQTFG